MSAETIQLALREKFAAPLPEFYRRRIVFWQDPDREFEEALGEISLPGVKMLRLTETNRFSAKKLLLADDPDSDYLVYDPFSYPTTRENWLRDILLYSESFRADLTSMRLAELSAEDTPALRKTVRLYRRFLDSADRRQRLRRIGRGYQRPLELHLDILSVLAGCPGEGLTGVLIALLSAGLDAEKNPVLESIRRLGDPETFWQLVERYAGYQDGPERPLDELLAHILLTALSQQLKPSALAGLERFLSDSGRPFCTALVTDWLSRGDTDPLWDLCRRLEQDLNLPARFAQLESEQLLTSALLPSLHEELLGRLYDQIAQGTAWADTLLDAAERRRTAPWTQRFAPFYDCLWAMGRMRKFSEGQTEGFHFGEGKAVWRYYTQTGYKMDTSYRKLRLAFGEALRQGSSRLEDKLKQAASVMEQLYRGWFLGELTQCWVNTAAADWQAIGYLSEMSRQRRFYVHYILPLSKRNSRAFVIISDALRYEVAVQLRDAIARETRDTVTLEATQGTFPTITKFGMAALLPGDTLTLDEKQEVLMDDLPTRTTRERETVLQKKNPKSTALKYGDLIPLKRPQRRELVSGKEVVYIYHNVIDATGEETVTEEKVFSACEEAVKELLSLYRIVAGDLQGTDIFITADHGFLYTADPIPEGEKLGSGEVQGQVLEMGRRHIIAQKGATSETLLPVRLEDDSCQGFAPREALRLRTPGGEKYVHGGISLQELVVPVLVCKHQRSGGKNSREAENAEVVLLSTTRKVANMAFRLDFLQSQPIGDKIRPCTYTIYMEDEAGTLVSDRQQLIADRESEDATKRVFELRFHLRPGSYSRQKTYRLVITNGVDLPQKTDFVIDVMFGDDFGFDL